MGTANLRGPLPIAIIDFHYPIYITHLHCPSNHFHYQLPDVSAIAHYPFPDCRLTSVICLSELDKYQGKRFVRNWIDGSMDRC